MNIADFLQIADVSEDFCELHCISAKLLRYMCVKVAHMNICIGKTRATYILYRENLHDLHICVLIVFKFEFEFQTFASTFEVRECEYMCGLLHVYITELKHKHINARHYITWLRIN